VVGPIEQCENSWAKSGGAQGEASPVFQKVGGALAQRPNRSLRLCNRCDYNICMERERERELQQRLHQRTVIDIDELKQLADELCVISGVDYKAVSSSLSDSLKSKVVL